MTLPNLFVLTVLQNVSTDCLQKAVNELVEGSMTITLTRRTATEVRALVKNGDGHEYGVTLTLSLATCSCKDALYRGVVCKHVTGTALSILRSSHQEQQPHRTIHLVRQTGTALCGASNPTRFWRWPFWPETLWQESCRDCEEMRRRSVTRVATATA
ncbi:MAG: SWIM zinc finger family protein [Candidatus Binatia bacterium]